jgi:predicted kinase
VCPGRTRTEKTPRVVEREAKAQGVSTDEIEQRMAGFNLIRR